MSDAVGAVRAVGAEEGGQGEQALDVAKEGGEAEGGEQGQEGGGVVGAEGDDGEGGAAIDPLQLVEPVYKRNRYRKCNNICIFCINCYHILGIFLNLLPPTARRSGRLPRSRPLSTILSRRGRAGARTSILTRGLPTRTRRTKPSQSQSLALTPKGRRSACCSTSSDCTRPAPSLSRFKCSFTFSEK